MGGSSGSLWEVCPSWKALGEQRGKHVPAGSTGDMDTPAAGVGLGAPTVLSQQERLVLLHQSGGSDQAGLMDPPPAPSGVEGLEQIMLCPDHPNDCYVLTRASTFQGQGMDLSALTRKMLHTRNNSQDQDRSSCPGEGDFLGLVTKSSLFRSSAPKAARFLQGMFPATSPRGASQ